MLIALFDKSLVDFFRFGLAGIFLCLVIVIIILGPESPGKPEPIPPTPIQICVGHKGIRTVSGSESRLYVTCNDNYYQETER